MVLALEKAMRRRDFIAGIAGSAAGWPIVVRAQGIRRPLLGVLIYSTPERDPNTQSFLRGLQNLGYLNGQNIDLVYRFAEGKSERLPDLAAELVRMKPDVIFALGGDVVPFVGTATQTIPIVYAMSADPVQLGMAAGLARPGGNATGVTFLSDELAAKRLEISRRPPCHGPHEWDFSGIQIMPDNELPVARRAALALGMQLHSVEMRSPGDLDSALSAAAKAGIDFDLRRLIAASSRERRAHRRLCHTRPIATRRRLGSLGLARWVHLLRSKRWGNGQPDRFHKSTKSSKGLSHPSSPCSNRHVLNCR